MNEVTITVEVSPATRKLACRRRSTQDGREPMQGPEFALDTGRRAKRKMQGSKDIMQGGRCPLRGDLHAIRQALGM